MDIRNHSAKDLVTCVEFSGVSFSYGEELVLKNISFDLKQGEYLGVIGPNGGGKTTLLKLLLGLLRPDAGEVKIFGQNIFELKNERAHIGYVPQRAVQIDRGFPATVEEVVMSGRTARVGLFRSFIDKDLEAVEKALNITDMERYRKTLISTLSGGEKQRVFIARAIAGEPQVLVLDEPTVGVDASSQEQFYSFLSELNTKYGLTIVLVSHDIDIVSQEVKTLLCVNRELVYSGPISNFLKEGRSPEVLWRRVNSVGHGQGVVKG